MRQAITLCIALSVFYCGTLSLAQESESSGIKASKSESWPPTWIEGVWEVKDARVIEDQKSTKPRHGHQDIVIFIGSTEFELFLPNNEKHSPFGASAATISLTTKDDEGAIYCQGDYMYSGEERKVRFKVLPSGEENDKITITYLNRRSSGKAWQYRLMLEKVENAEQLREVALAVRAEFERDNRNNGRDVFAGPEGVDNLQVHHRDLLRKWVDEHTGHQP